MMVPFPFSTVSVVGAFGQSVCTGAGMSLRSKSVGAWLGIGLAVGLVLGEEEGKELGSML